MMTFKDTFSFYNVLQLEPIISFEENFILFKLIYLHNTSSLRLTSFQESFLLVIFAFSALHVKFLPLSS